MFLTNPIGNMPSEKRLHSRVWGAVMTPDGPVCEVRDVTLDELRRDWSSPATEDQAFRIWRVASLDFPMDREGHSRGPACEPGRPCKKCQETALRWWWEYGRRTRERKFYAVHANAYTRNGWAAKDWGEGRATLDEAMQDARTKGFAYVQLVNGHGNHLERFEVAP